MRTLIITGSDSSMHEVLDLSVSSKQKYAFNHGYDFMCLRSFSADKKCGFDSRHIGFLRATTCFKLLRQYEHIMWIDADALITNPNYKISDFVNEKSCVTASYDWMHYTTFSTGNFIVSRNDDTQKLFDMFLQISRFWLNDILQEQGTLNYIYSNLPEYKHMFNILPHKFLNSVPSCLINTKTWRQDNNRTGIVDPWTPESFLVHLTGTSASERVNLIKEYWPNL